MKQFDPAAFLELAKPRAAAQNMAITHRKGDGGGGGEIAEHIWLGDESYTHVIALTDNSGDWFPVMESPNYSPDHLANVLRRVAYTRITGKFTTAEDKD